MGDINFQLNARIPEEAALIDYLDRFPRDRHAEQLRRLALIGFRHLSPLHDRGTGMPRDAAQSELADGEIDEHPIVSGPPSDSSSPAENSSLASLQSVIG